MKKSFLIIGLVSLFAMAASAQNANTFIHDANIFIKKIKDNDSTTLFVQSKPNDKRLFLKVKDGEPIAIYIEGKRYDSDILDILDQDKISSVAVLNGEFAMKKYKEPNVILIITKKGKENRAQQRIENGVEYPIVIIDGKQVSKEELKKIPKDVILSVNVLKDEKSKKKYKTEVGVIMVTTKKGNK